jgi:nucleotide-binding universal stress UspA family protein
MSKTASKVRRILLPVDLSRDSLTAVDVAFDLAAALGGEISGLFIEDAELLTAGSLPFAREVGSSSGIPRPIGYSDIEHRLRSVAHKARTTLTQAGRRMKVRSCFRVARGDVSGEILTATGDADLVVLGKAGWSVGTLRKPGKTCQALLAKSHVPLLIVERGNALSPPILAVHDDTPAGHRALEFARELSVNLKWDLTIFAVRGMTSGDEVLQRIQPPAPRLIVLPSTLPLTYPSRLNSPVVFVP